MDGLRAQRMLMPVTGAESWTVVEEDLVTIGDVERYLAHLAAIERCPNTVRAYAPSLALWCTFLQQREVERARAGIDDVAEFVRWLRAPASNVIVLHASAARRSEATVNRHLAAVFGFYDFQLRAGVNLAESLVAWRRVPRGSFKPLLYHVTKARPIPTRPVKLRVPRRLPATLTGEQVTVLLGACGRLRDRFLLALLAETGIFSGGRPLRRRFGPRSCAAQRLMGGTLAIATGVVQLSLRRVTGGASRC